MLILICVLIYSLPAPASFHISSKPANQCAWTLSVEWEGHHWSRLIAVVLLWMEWKRNLDADPYCTSQKMICFTSLKPKTIYWQESELLHEKSKNKKTMLSKTEGRCDWVDIPMIAMKRCNSGPLLGYDGSSITWHWIGVMMDWL